MDEEFFLILGKKEMIHLNCSRRRRI